ncbi:MAG TPA: hypothetical protein V6D03_14990, partial [Candidatus Caenarcaniphilales bacterium]
MEPLIVQTKDTNLVSDPALAKLIEVDSDLAVQEAKLITQLQEIQQKRKSLEAVISLFAPDDAQAASSNQAVEVLATAQPAVDETDLGAPVPEPSTRSSLRNDEVTPQQGAQTQKAKRSAAAARRTKVASTTLAPASSRKTESWRRYVRDDFEASAALPEMAFKVLQRLPDRVFAVPEIMNAIFINEIPKEAYKKAHNRLLSILSQGVKENQWQRSNKG